MARGLELDLVEIAPMASPPVCKILDFGKYRYELAQKDKESRRKAQTIAIKEMKYRPKIGGGDFDTKTRKVGEFLSEGHKVKVTIMFRGREVAHPELGKAILDRIAVNLHLVAKVEAMPKLDGKNMIMVLAPDKKKVEKDETGAPATPAAVVPTAVPSAPLTPAAVPTPKPPVSAPTPAPPPASTAPVAPASVPTAAAARPAPAKAVPAKAVPAKAVPAQAVAAPAVQPAPAAATDSTSA
jgi:translation initiation factor IF-3